MKIAVVHWIVNDVGGINSWTENFIVGLRRLGHVVQLFYGSHQQSLGCLPDSKVLRSKRWHLLPSIHLSYRDQDVLQSIRALNEFDLIVFAHPSPHPTKCNLSVKSPKGWQKFYTETTPKKISVFHDRHWDRSNPWIAEVKECIDYTHAAQHHFLSCVKSLQCKNCGWGLFPLLIADSSLPSTSRVRRWILATQWLAIKNHRRLIPHLERLELPLHSYGSGQTYHTLLPEIKRVYKEDKHYGKLHNPKSQHVHFGHQEYRSLINAMRRSWFSLDMSIQGMTNMTHWEPMTVGCISVLEKRVLEDPFCEIPSDCCLSFSLDTLLDDLNSIGRTSSSCLKKIQLSAWNLVQQCECSKIAKQILSRVEV